jgi:hypothetical protein
MSSHLTPLETILNRAGELSPDAARYLQKMSFPPELIARARELSDTAQERQLSPAEQAELDEILILDSLLTIFHTKAAQRLAAKNPAA